MAINFSFLRIDDKDHEEKTEETFSVVESFEDRTDCLKKIISEFEEHLAKSVDHSLGYPLNLNCNPYIALSPLFCFHINNCGDAFNESNFSSNSKRFELGVLNWFARLWEIRKNEYWGYITNGGTEGNLHGILLGRELLPDGILYVSKETHYSIFKIARMYRMDCKVIDASIKGEIDCNDLKEKLKQNKDKPAIINVNIGTTFKGGVDNLDLVIETLYECGFSENRFYIHCDAALYGLMLPLLEQEPSLSFKKPIGSIAVSAHKLLGSPMPCGVLMTRKKYISLLATRIDYIACLDTTISGSRNGHAAVFMWYGLNIKGLMGLKREINACLKNARYLRDGLRNAGISTMLNDNSNIVVFERPLEKYFKNNWELSCVGNMAHVVVMQHVTTQVLDEFLEDLVRHRSSWYGSFDDVRPPCIAEEIGTSNCACFEHGKGFETSMF
ncbi:serine decarboxylase-like [Andrographis paniculata]|uniref:serine decarboxylase-like n=1 Tax=Andrographis paniculata TaxID=175694 RepID=UPI0021E7FD02|nr:serine decarboxylase-like [Andrographis paniculata]